MNGEDFRRALAGLDGQESVPQSHIDLYADILSAQDRAKKRIEPKLSPVPRRGLGKRFDQGLPLLSADVIKVPARGLDKLFRDICLALKSHNRQTREDVEVLEEAKKKKKLKLGELVRSVSFGQGEYCRELSEQLMLKYELLLFLGLAIARPLFELWSESLRGAVKDEMWLRPYCPVCGHEPFMAKLHKEDGRRILACPLCGTEWAYRRVECPFCLNGNQKTLRYFFVDESSPYRVDVCDKCKRYIKTVDERKGDEGKSLLFEDIATQYLDVLAEREGYSRADRSAAA